ncbi:Imm72 family immunity protein [Holophaga foetida]|uniref:Imm72 family immunity protein n=1 Tax=Holophaga foetida TaxID=35839 RepID=UPI00024745F5|nr:Imm72 family immunity protein [Holophaga foetida]
MISEYDLRKIFWLLKRYTSLGLWQKIGEVHKTFFDLVEHEIQNHPQNDPDSMLVNLYRYALNDQIRFERGLKRLSQGDRSVLRQNPEGDLYHSGAASNYVIQLDTFDCTPDGWPRLEEPGKAADRAFHGVIYEPGEDQPAAYYSTWLLLPQNLPKHAFPNPLPLVPALPARPILVKTGQQVPVDGIYEPEGEGTCMNYLLGGTIAPKVLREYGELTREYLGAGEYAMLPDTETIPTTWHLIWEDHRYEDGTVPEEEKDYFLPMPGTPLESPQPPDGIRRALPGEACTRPGYWSTLAKSGSRRCFKQGEVFPDFPDSKIARTIWNYDPDQEERD